MTDPNDWLPSEALFAFMGWLTSRHERVTFSASDDASPAVELVDRFCKRHGLANPRDSERWFDAIVPAADDVPWPEVDLSDLPNGGVSSTP